VIVNGLKPINNKDKIVMKHQLDNNLWSTYQKTWFKLSKLPNLNKNLCVITAFNPHGIARLKDQNIYQNRELAHELKAMAIDVIELLAGNEDFSYYEPSYIFECERHKAVALGVKWQQNAIFWVEQGQLYLLACQALDGVVPSPVCLGTFLERTQLISTLD